MTLRRRSFGGSSLFAALLLCAAPGLAQPLDEETPTAVPEAATPAETEEIAAEDAQAEDGSPNRNSEDRQSSVRANPAAAPEPPLAPVVLEEAPPEDAHGSGGHSGGATNAAPASPDGAVPSEDEAGPISAGLDPRLPEFGPTTGTTVQVGKNWEFEFHGYLRAPMRMGIGPKNDGTEGNEEHAPPRVPDLSFTDWTYTHNLPGAWTQLLFSVGSENVSATVGIASFNHTNAGFRNLQANLGINESFLTLQYPKVFGRFGGLSWRVGSFSNRYGTAGKYNAGFYNTYLFGRTRVSGETLTAGLNLTRDLLLTLEHGFGAKLDVIPSETTNPRPDYLPYGGPRPQGTTWLHHAHATLRMWKKLTLGGHYLRTKSPDDQQLPGAPSTPGYMQITGGEVRATLGAFGDGYVGYSHIDAEEILVLADAVEVLHSFAGWNFKNNYFGRYNQRTGQAAPDTSGKVDSLLFQYDLSLGALARYPTRFTGNGPDLKASVFGMFNKVRSENNTHDKFKWGGQVVYTPFPVVGIGARYDLVQPDLADSNQSFAIVSPKLIFSTAFVTKEEIIVQYSRYFLGSRAYPSFPYSGIDEADQHALMISGSMWW